jgi:hypothetical protein
MTTSLVDSDLDSVPITLALPLAGGDRSNEPGAGPCSKCTEFSIQPGAGTSGTAPGRARPFIATRRPACQTRAGSKLEMSSKQSTSAW